ncbi:IS3 family transposase [Streptomyces sp. NBC_00114]|nr:IS3 family transposase [Streptomyces sp. NBC_00078]MCX5420898.1 IS3 family transposase [Streptomyces sp. NBC_00078]
MADPALLVGVISDQKTVHSIPYRTSCRALGVSEAWFYKWRRRPSEPTKREIRRAELAERIRCFFDRSGRTYGSPRITLDLWEEGWQVSQNTVAEIMAELGLQGRKPPRRRRSLTRPGKRKTAPDLVRRKFDAIAPNILWWGDMTEIETSEGKLYHRIRPRRLLPPRPWLRDGRAARCRAGQRRPADGDRDPGRPGRRRHFPHGPRHRRWIQLVVATP